MAKASAVTKKPKTQPRRLWSKDDMRVLKTMARKEPLAKIAKALKRTPGATRHRATIEGISLRIAAAPKKRAARKKAPK
jgi:hypothetical protein